MNALEMAGMAMVERMLANLPEEKKAQLAQIMETVVGVQAQLDRIESQNRAIMAHFKITEATPCETARITSDVHPRN